MYSGYLEKYQPVLGSYSIPLINVHVYTYTCTVNVGQSDQHSKFLRRAQQHALNSIEGAILIKRCLQKQRGTANPKADRYNPRNNCPRGDNVS